MSFLELNLLTYSINASIILPLSISSNVSGMRKQTHKLVALHFLKHRLKVASKIHFETLIKNDHGNPFQNQLLGHLPYSEFSNRPVRCHLHTHLSTEVVQALTSKDVVLKQVVSPSPRSLLETQNLRPCPIFLESESTLLTRPSLVSHKH